MKIAIIISLFCITELYGVALLGYLYSLEQSALNLSLLIVSVIVTAITSIIFTIILLPKKIEQKPNNCPYFIDKEGE